jgi:hypothetical protein
MGSGIANLIGQGDVESTQRKTAYAQPGLRACKALHAGGPDAGTQYSSPKARQIAMLLDHWNAALADHTDFSVSARHHHHHRRPNCDRFGRTCFDSRPSTSFCIAGIRMMPNRPGQFKRVNLTRMMLVADPAESRMAI